jgi:hypothetical protein
MYKEAKADWDAWASAEEAEGWPHALSDKESSDG